MPKFSGIDYEKTKAAVAAVVGFNEAHGVSYSRVQLAKHFGITTQSLRNWFPASSSKISQSIHGTEDRKNEGGSVGQKRARSEGPTDVAPSAVTASQQSTAPSRQNPVRNGGRGRKRLKRMLEDEEDMPASSPPPLSSPSPTDSYYPPPEQPLTPPKRKIYNPRNKAGSKDGRQSHSEGGIVKIESELQNEGNGA
jgi:hypothetical protein